MSAPDVVIEALEQLDANLLRIDDGGRGSFRHISYRDGRPLYVRLGPGKCARGVEVWGQKRSIRVRVEDPASFGGLQAWLESVADGPDVQAIVRDAEVKVRLPTTAAGEFDGGVFDEHSTPCGVAAITPGVTVRGIAQVLAVWTMGDKSGLVLDAKQLQLAGEADACMIVEDDDPYIPYHRPEAPAHASATPKRKAVCLID